MYKCIKNLKNKGKSRNKLKIRFAIFNVNINKVIYGQFGRQAVFNGCSSESPEPEPADGRIRLGPCLNALPVFRVGMPGMVAVVAAKKIGRKVLTKFSANVISVIWG